MKRNGRKSLAGALARAKNESGFTLVELIVVIAILGILAGVGTVGYSGYIKKANMAADEILLDSLNTAFAAACIENGVATPPTTPSLAWTGKSVTGVSVYEDEFLRYYEENAEYKVYTAGSVIFRNGMFVYAGESITGSLPNGGVVSLTQEQIDLINKSSLAGNIGGVLTQIDGVSGTVAALLTQLEGSDTSQRVMGEFMSDESNLTRMITSLGGTVDPDAPLLGQYVAALDGFSDTQVKKELANKYGLDPDAIDFTKPEYDRYFDEYNEMSEASKAEIEKNLLVMSIAQSAVGQSANDVKTVIQNGNIKNSLVNSMLGDNSAKGMGTTALVYGVFTAYANSSVATQAAKDAVSNTSDPTAVFDCLDNPEELDKFQKYIADEQGGTDLDACIAAMDVINNTASDNDAVAGILAGGFANNDFVAAINNLLK